MQQGNAASVLGSLGRQPSVLGTCDSVLFCCCYRFCIIIIYLIFIFL